LGKKKIRVLVIDDSAYNRRAISEVLQSREEIAVVATAADGEEGLRAALELKPDVITLDLEMPRVDGFTFLRLLRAKVDIPVIVISGYARRHDVFKALEMGAFDFVAKPARYFSKEAKQAGEELLAKIVAARQSRKEAGAKRARPERAGEPGPLRVAVLGASTGGPPALQRLFSALPGDLPLGIVVAQHMPERFTKAFAERLNRASAFEVSEARNGDRLSAGRALIAPGGKHLSLVEGAESLAVSLADAPAGDKYVPSIDALFFSAARVAGDRAAGVLLTGMGSDGRDGLLALRCAGALTVAEAEESAVIFGMPKEAIAAGAAVKVLRLEVIAEELARFARGEWKSGAAARVC
jgi:two-component system chemotaxis response regulator CheB